MNHGVASWVVGNWQLGGTITRASGVPFTVGTSSNLNAPGQSNSANQINKVNLSMSARSNNRFGKTGQYLRNSLSTQVSIRSLAYVDQYK